MDISRRIELGHDERLDIASFLHAILLDETFCQTRWGQKDAVFHGGTSLHVAHGSDRFSEDLDFMLADGRQDELAAVAQKVCERVRHRVATALPGSQIALQVKPPKPGPDRLDVWNVRWSHPMRHGVVIVKMEFYKVLGAHLDAYAARLMLPIGPNGIRMTTPIPVGELHSLWADKVKAIATRPAFKWRDAHDLAFIATRATNDRNFPNNDGLRAALCRTADIYNKSAADVLDGLERRLADGTFGEYGEFAENMRAWFPAVAYQRYETGRAFDQMLDSAKYEVERGVMLMRQELGLSFGGRP